MLPLICLIYVIPLLQLICLCDCGKAFLLCIRIKEATINEINPSNNLNDNQILSPKVIKNLLFAIQSFECNSPFEK